MCTCQGVTAPVCDLEVHIGAGCSTEAPCLTPGPPPAPPQLNGGNHDAAARVQVPQPRYRRHEICGKSMTRVRPSLLFASLRLRFPACVSLISTRHPFSTRSSQVNRVIDHIKSLPKKDGLVPIFINANNGRCVSTILTGRRPGQRSAARFFCALKSPLPLHAFFLGSTAIPSPSGREETATTSICSNSGCKRSRAKTNTRSVSQLSSSQPVCEAPSLEIVLAWSPRHGAN